MSLTMMLAWFVVVALFQAIFSLSTVVRKFVAVDSRYPMFNKILSHFLMPAAWLWLAIYLFDWVAQTYHVEARLYALLDSNLVQRANLAQFNTREVFLVIFVGIGLYFFINAIKLGDEGIFRRLGGVRPSAVVHDPLELCVVGAFCHLRAGGLQGAIFQHSGDTRRHEYGAWFRPQGDRRKLHSPD